MNEAGIRQAERRIWATVLDVAPACDSVEVYDPWRKGGPLPFQLPIGRDGAGLLSWLPAARCKRLRSIASGPVQGDRLQLILIQTALKSMPINARLMVRSHWSRRGVPLTEAMRYPEGVVLGQGEADAALAAEADYRCLWLTKNGRASALLAFDAEEYSDQELRELGNNLRDPEYQARYGEVKGISPTPPRYSRRYPLASIPESRFLVVHQSRDAPLALTRTYTRLFRSHRVFDILNLHDPIAELCKEAE